MIKIPFTIVETGRRQRARSLMHTYLCLHVHACTHGWLVGSVDMSRRTGISSEAGSTECCIGYVPAGTYLYSGPKIIRNPLNKNI